MAVSTSRARNGAITRSSDRRAAWIALVLLAGAAGETSRAVAAPAWFARAFRLHSGDHRALGARPTRYSIDSGGSFVFSQDGRALALRFDDSPEIWALTSVRGPRGDTLFLNDLGQPLLRTTRLGGVTVFTHRRPEGAAASAEGPADIVRPSRVDPAQLYQRLLLASMRASRAAGHLIAFEALEVDAASSAAIADAVTVAGEAVVRLSMAQSGRAILSRVARFDFARGRSANVSYGAGVVVVTVRPDGGPAGRPSSARVLQAVGVGLAMPVLGPY